MDKISCTVGVLTFNNESSLGDTLDLLKGFAEVIICDGGSTDRTLDIAKSHGCKIIFQDPEFKRPDGKIKDFAGVRNQMLDSASHRWFLYVDSDEILTPELIAEISSVVSAGNPGAYWIPRKYVVNGLIIDCASTYPAKQMRLFHRDAVNRFIKTIHERIEVKPEAKISELRNYMLIPMTTDTASIQRKWDYYLDLEEARRGTITIWQWLQICGENLKISALYTLRTFRNMLFCHGNGMPLALELQRHIYHIKMCRRLFKKVKF